MPALLGLIDATSYAYRSLFEASSGLFCRSVEFDLAAILEASRSRQLARANLSEIHVHKTTPPLFQISGLCVHSECIVRNGKLQFEFRQEGEASPVIDLEPDSIGWVVRFGLLLGREEDMASIDVVPAVVPLT